MDERQWNLTEDNWYGAKKAVFRKPVRSQIGAHLRPYISDVISDVIINRRTCARSIV